MQSVAHYRKVFVTRVFGDLIVCKMSTPKDSVTYKIGNLLRRVKKGGDDKNVDAKVELPAEVKPDVAELISGEPPLLLSEKSITTEPASMPEVVSNEPIAVLDPIPANLTPIIDVAPIEAKIVKSNSVVSNEPIIKRESATKKPEAASAIEYVKLKNGSYTSSLHEASSDNDEEGPVDAKKGDASNFEFFAPPPSISMRVIVRIRPLSEGEMANRANVQKFVQANSDGKTIQAPFFLTRFHSLIIELLQYHLTEFLVQFATSRISLTNPGSRK